MPNSPESLLAELTKELRANTEGYIRLETTMSSEFEGLRSDIVELKDTVNRLATTQMQQGERLIASETRISDLQELRKEFTALHSEHRGLKSLVEATAPVRTPWTAIVSSVVALVALAYAILGK